MKTTKLSELKEFNLFRIQDKGETVYTACGDGWYRKTQRPEDSENRAYSPGLDTVWALPWDVRQCNISDRSGLYLHGFNHYDNGHCFSWHVSSFESNEFASIRYDFSRCEFGNGAKEQLRKYWPECPIFKQKGN